LFTAESRSYAEVAGVNELTEKVIGAAIAVHRELGPGLLESTYQTCLAFELTARTVPFEQQLAVPLIYRGIRLDCGYRLDLLVDDKLVVEVKAVEKIERVFVAQILTYLRLTGCRVGLLINFNTTLLKDGIHRFVQGYTGPTPRSSATPR
jgi:GxxExxY protein